MNPALTITLTLLILIVAAVAIGWALSRRRQQHERERQQHARQETGPEFDHQAERHGGIASATDRIETRRQSLNVRELTPRERERYTHEWNGLQNAFLDRPGLALIEADRLVAELMRDRGFRSDHIDDAALDLSLEHKTVVDRYRSAHDLVESGTTDIQQQRQAMLHYRTVVDDLLAVNLRSEQERAPRDP